MISLAALAILACGPSPSDHAEAYARAADIAASEPEAAATLCRQTGEAVDECLAMTAAAAAPGDPARARSLCEGIEGAVWRDECAFLVAESLVATDGDAAAAACARAGRFAENCITHLWRLHARHLQREEEDIATAAGRYAGVGAWADGIIEAGSARDSRLWNKFYEGALEERGLDLGWCASFPPELTRRCTQELPASLRKALNRAHREAGTRGEPLDAEHLCGPGPLHERIEAATGLRYAPSEELDAVAERFAAPYCGGGRPR